MYCSVRVLVFTASEQYLLHVYSNIMPLWQYIHVVLSALLL